MTKQKKQKEGKPEEVPELEGAEYSELCTFCQTEVEMGVEPTGCRKASCKARQVKLVE
jgi:hypothetical protein